MQSSIDELAFRPCEVEHTCRTIGAGWEITAVSSMFMHGSWLHILGNMLFLWIFGNNVEDAMGRIKYLIFYFLSGFAATRAADGDHARNRDVAGCADAVRRRERRDRRRARRLLRAAADAPVC